MKELQAALTICYRDVSKFLRDRGRIVATFIFPIVFIGILGGSFQANLGDGAGFNFLTFVFTGTLAQTLFQSAASGIISLIEDRENDFSQEIFVSPVSRYTIIVGKILGESTVALIQAVGVALFGLLIGIHFTLNEILVLIPAAIIVCLAGGAFGVMVMSQLTSQRAANQIFPFLIFPQFFLAGVFSPIRELPWYLFYLSRIAPMTYAVDFVRGMFYMGSPEYDNVVLYSPLLDLAVLGVLSTIFIVIGTYAFVRNERNK